MTGADDEFDDFLKRRKPVFRSPDDLYEPPAELDRVVLRQAREAIETDRPVRVFKNPRWAAPMALAATLVLGFTVIFYAGLPQSHAPVPEVTVQNVAERVEIPAAEAPMESASPAITDHSARTDAGTVMVDLPPPTMAKRASGAAAAPVPNGGLVSEAEAERHAAPPPPSAPMLAREAAGGASERSVMATTADASTVTMSSPPPSTEVPTWRHDAKSWLAEIERLRNAGDTARADAEYAEFKRQQRAFAGAPDR